MTTATRSLTVVMRGPEATAGSMLIFLKNRGISVPTALEMAMASSREIPMQPDTAEAVIRSRPRNSQIYRPISTKDASPSSRPLAEPMRTSLTTSPNFCRKVRFSSISTRMVTASDWVPTLPAMSRMSDWKHMISVSCDTTCSNAPTTVDTKRPSPSSANSQGRRFCMLCFSGSVRSSSAVRPARRA